MLKNLGFTLIELLVVIAVLGILATAVVVAINPVAKLGQARNAQRKNDLGILANALSTYYVTHLAYPVSTSWRGESVTFGSYINDYIPGFVASGELTKLPSEPLLNQPNNTTPACTTNPGYRGYLYITDATGSCYKLLSHCGPEGTLSATDPFYDPVRPTYTWMICGPTGSACCGY